MSGVAPEVVPGAYHATILGTNEGEVALVVQFCMGALHKSAEPLPTVVIQVPREKSELSCSGA